MVCSGDPGILAMAGLLFELRAREPEFADIPIRVLPGITAANIAAARCPCWCVVFTSGSPRAAQNAVAALTPTRKQGI